MNMWKIALLSAALISLSASASNAGGHKKAPDCSCDPETGFCHTVIDGDVHILGPVLVLGPQLAVANYQINDALLSALQSLKTSDPNAYLAVAASFDKLPADDRDALTTGLGLSITDSTVTRSVDYSQLLQMNTKALQLDVNAKQ
jgi:hypothetical protein